MQKPQNGGKFSVEIPGGARGMVMAKIDSCIMISNNFDEHFETIIVT